MPKLSPLHYRDSKIDPKLNKVLTSELSYTMGDSWDPLTIRVPEHFGTNLISIPSWLTWLFHRDGKAAPAAVVHDYLYRHGKCSRSLADAIFYDALKTLGIPLPIRFLFWTYVRLDGWRVYPTNPKWVNKDI